MRMCVNIIIGCCDKKNVDKNKSLVYFEHCEVNMVDKIAVVTGANKGVGYAIVQELLERGVGVVYLTARDLNRGKTAVDGLNKIGLKPHFYQLDITNNDSVKTFAEHIKANHGGLDILINNAAVIDNDFFETNYEDAKRVIDGNYRTMFSIQEYLFPILNNKARVINVSSDCGHMYNIKNTYWIQRLTKDDLKVEDIDAFVNWFLGSVRNETLNKDDFANMMIIAYKISKIALCALTRIQQNEIGKDISINSLHPGFVKTDMTKGLGMITAEEASKVPVYLALDVDQSVKGKYFWFDKTQKEWADPTLKLYDDKDVEIINNILKEL